MISNGKVAIVLILEEIEVATKTNIANSAENVHLLSKALLDDHLKFIKVVKGHTSF